MSLVLERMSRNAHQMLAIQRATRYAEITVMPMRRTRSTWSRIPTMSTVVAPLEIRQRSMHARCRAAGAARPRQYSSAFRGGLRLRDQGMATPPRRADFAYLDR